MWTHHARLMAMNHEPAVRCSQAQSQRPGERGAGAMGQIYPHATYPCRCNLDASDHYPQAVVMRFHASMKPLRLVGPGTYILRPRILARPRAESTRDGNCNKHPSSHFVSCHHQQKHRAQRRTDLVSEYLCVVGYDNFHRLVGDLEHLHSRPIQTSTQALATTCPSSPCQMHRQVGVGQPI